ncbi:RDD family protein [Wolbachia endosymbiont of Anopheles demeilloni]|uniref:RDD family protein n=1 Tax=Wolbachia endosymbiont of Anopheles demeilloni TaxID=2748871 RepID=UPI001BDA2D60|nr:RDD family protein [Wolbachia endosymbiont of Anopheles demeilloni]UIP93267.1 RDD family protein [Wolbachia endosymbiont of Anopheles demeilloni]
MDTKISYAGITRRIFEFAIDYILVQGMGFVIGFIIGFTLAYSLSLNVTEMILDKAVATQVIGLILEVIFYVFTIIEFGGTPGQLLLRMRVKDENTLEKITLIQAISRTAVFGVLYFIICYTLFNISSLFIVVSILIILFKILDQRKQFLHDKIAKTVVIDYKPS